MRFLVPVGGVVDDAFGILTTYQHHGVVAGIRGGLPWAADNCAFGDKFDADKLLTWLPQMIPFRSTCLFVAVPDVVGDSAATLARWAEWIPRLTGWPLAFVCQDGLRPEQIPVECTVIFIGGTTEWKLSEYAIDCIRWAQANGKGVHIGRVNWGRRYAHFRVMRGSEYFTTDGTRTRFDGREKALRAWKHYMNQKPLLQLD